MSIVKDINIESFRSLNSSLHEFPFLSKALANTEISALVPHIVANRAFTYGHMDYDSYVKFRTVFDPPTAQRTSNYNLFLKNSFDALATWSEQISQEGVFTKEACAQSRQKVEAGYRDYTALLQNCPRSENPAFFRKWMAHPEAYIRKDAPYNLHYLPEGTQIEFIYAGLRDDDSLVRIATVTCAGPYLSKSDLSDFFLMASRDPDGYVREAAWEQVAALPVEQQREFINRGIFDPDEWVEDDAEQCLGSQSKEWLYHLATALLENTDETLKRRALSLAAKHLSENDQLGFFTKVLKESNTSFAIDAVDKFPMNTDPTLLLAFFRQAMKHPHFDVCQAAANRLVFRQNDINIMRGLNSDIAAAFVTLQSEFVARGLADANPAAQTSAMSYSANLLDPEFRKFIEQGLAHETRDVRFIAHGFRSSNAHLFPSSK